MLVNGLLGDHGAAILGARGDMALETPIESDCAPLHGLIEALLAAAPGVRCVRDADARRARDGAERDRRGVAGRHRDRRERDAPARRGEGFCEILGLDPLYLANEGKIVAIAPPDEADAALAAMRAHPLGKRAAIIGRAHRASRGA